MLAVSCAWISYDARREVTLVYKAVIVLQRRFHGEYELCMKRLHHVSTVELLETYSKYHVIFEVLLLLCAYNPNKISLGFKDYSPANTPQFDPKAVPCEPSVIPKKLEASMVRLR